MDKSLENLLEDRGVRPTAMRLLVLKFLAHSKTAKTLNSIQDALEKADRTTLYRTIKLFEKKGIVHQIDNGTGAANYALCDEDCDCTPNKGLHMHFHCTGCGETMCMPQRVLPKLDLPEDYTLENYNLVVKGKCHICSKL
ncbi:Fur family transcriptional regulator [Flagellimonas sp. 2504JD4-2]